MSKRCVDRHAGLFLNLQHHVAHGIRRVNRHQDTHASDADAVFAIFWSIHRIPTPVVFWILLRALVLIGTRVVNFSDELHDPFAALFLGSFVPLYVSVALDDVCGEEQPVAGARDGILYT